MNVRVIQVLSKNSRLNNYNPKCHNVTKYILYHNKNTIEYLDSKHLLTALTVFSMICEDHTSILTNVNCALKMTDESLKQFLHKSVDTNNQKMMIKHFITHPVHV